MLNLLSAEDVDALPDLEWVIVGVLPAPAFGVLYGEPGCGKTFTALSMALAIASGTPWLGRETRQAPVLYIAAEGVLGLKRRLQAHYQKHGMPAPSPEQMRFIASAIEIMKPASVVAVLATLNDASFKPGLIIIDTLARVALGADENSATDMGHVVEGFDRLKRETGATVLVLHHSRKSGGSVERGSSALRGAADVMIQCEAMGEGKLIGVKLECSKMKDAEPFDAIYASLDRIKLPEGGTSLVLGLDEFLEELKTPNEQKILGLLRERFAETGATHKQIKTAFVDAGYGSESTFSRAWRALRKTDEVVVEDGGKSVVFRARVAPEANATATG